MNWSKTLLAAGITAALAACGGGGGDGGNSGGGTDPGYEYTAYACDAALYEKAHELRIYQVMTEAFIDGDSNHDYNDGYGTSHHKGDLRGIIDSLDYIQSLGMNAIWMTPIFDSEGDSKLDATGYFTRNYFAIDPNFGTMDDARELVNEAHARGMYVIFDGVFGHHKGNVTPSPNGLTPSGPSNPVSYPGTDNDTLDFYKEVASYWVTELGIDGWRLDQAYQVPVGAWGEIRKAVEDASKSVSYQMDGETVNPLGYMVAEIWDGGGSQIRDEGYGPEAAPGVCSSFDFPMRYKLVQTFAVEESGTGGRDANNLVGGFNTHLANPAHAVPNGFIGNHDLVRFGDLLQRGNIAEPSDTEYWDRHKAAYAFVAAYSGPITLYYGEEIGDEVPGFSDQVENTVCADQGLCDDHVARNNGKIQDQPYGPRSNGQTFDADANQLDLRNYITTLMNLRKDTPALYKGERTAIAHDDSADVFFDHKQSGDSVVLFLSNTSTNSFSISVTGEEIGSDGQLRNMLSNETLDIASGAYTIEIDGLEPLFLEVLSPTAEGPQQGNGGNLVGSGPLANCSTPDSAEAGPVGGDVFMRGNYAGGGWGTPDSHKLSYKGDNLYQVVIDESDVTSFGFKFADADWGFELTTPSGLVTIATSQDLAKIGGEGTEMNVLIPEAGRYVYSMQVNDDLASGTMMVSKCE